MKSNPKCLVFNEMPQFVALLAEDEARARLFIGVLLALIIRDLGL